jgi:hypothetical protein
MHTVIITPQRIIALYAGIYTLGFFLEERLLEFVLDFCDELEVFLVVDFF